MLIKPRLFTFLTLCLALTLVIGLMVLGGTFVVRDSTSRSGISETAPKLPTNSDIAVDGYVTTITISEFRSFPLNKRAAGIAYNQWRDANPNLNVVAVDNLCQTGDRSIDCRIVAVMIYSEPKPK